MTTTTCKKMNGAEIVVETLIEQGVTDVFGYPGGQVLTIYDALYNASDRLSHVLTAHEQGASHAADGYARATGKVGVVIATSGPGATNLVTGIATAMLDSIPLIAITGNVASSQIGKDSFQEINITGVTMPITKHNYFVSDVEDNPLPLEITPADIAVYHEYGVDWVKLTTTFEIKDSIVYYTAETFSFSPFKLVVEESGASQVSTEEPVDSEIIEPVIPDIPQEILPPIEPPVKDEEPETPMPFLAVLAGLGVVVLIRRK